jgi:hypothetical protein
VGSQLPFVVTGSPPFFGRIPRKLVADGAMEFHRTGTHVSPKNLHIRRGCVQILGMGLRGASVEATTLCAYCPRVTVDRRCPRRCEHRSMFQCRGTVHVASVEGDGSVFAPWVRRSMFRGDVTVRPVD